MDRVLIALLQLLFLTAIVHSGSAAKCYQCLSTQDKKCSDPFMKTGDIQPTMCVLDSMKSLGKKVTSVLGVGGDSSATSEAQILCRKLVYTETNGEQHVVRGCDVPFSDTYDPCKAVEGKPQSHCSICEGEGCNGAGRLGGLTALFYLLLPCLVALKAIAA